MGEWMGEWMDGLADGWIGGWMGWIYFLHDFEGEAVMLLGDDELVDVLLTLDLLLLELLGYFLVDGADPGLGLFVQDAQLRVQIQILDFGSVHSCTHDAFISNHCRLFHVTNSPAVD